MAAEYSRELSVKVFSGQCRLIELGFREGGPAVYSLRRQLIDRDQTPKGLLGRGERKSLQTDRVILVPGPEVEIAVVQNIYELFVVHGKTEREISEALNDRGLLGEYERPWTRSTVHQILTNPKYIGANIYNRRSFKLKHKRINNPVEMWIWRDGAFDPIVDAAVFEQARRSEAKLANAGKGHKCLGPPILRPYSPREAGLECVPSNRQPWSDSSNLIDTDLLQFAFCRLY